MNLQITSMGRVGNLISRMKNVIQIALFYNYNIIVPKAKNKLINTNYIVINQNINKEDEKITDTYNFFFHMRIKNIDHSLWEINKEKTVKVLKDILNIKATQTEKYRNNDLVIHIRSGDIFEEKYWKNKKHYVKCYIVPPLDYYINIIESNNFDDIYLIAENKNNPQIDVLLRIYPNIKYESKSIIDDCDTILSAKNVVISTGTFAKELVEISEHIVNVWIPSYMEVLPHEKDKKILFQRFHTNKYNRIYIDLEYWWNAFYPITYNSETLKKIIETH